MIERDNLYLEKIVWLLAYSSGDSDCEPIWRNQISKDLLPSSDGQILFNMLEIGIHIISDTILRERVKSCIPHNSNFEFCPHRIEVFGFFLQIDEGLVMLTLCGLFPE